MKATRHRRLWAGWAVRWVYANAGAQRRLTEKRRALEVLTGAMAGEVAGAPPWLPRGGMR